MSTTIYDLWMKFKTGRWMIILILGGGLATISTFAVQLRYSNLVLDLLGGVLAYFIAVAIAIPVFYIGICFLWLTNLIDDVFFDDDPCHRGFAIVAVSGLMLCIIGGLAVAIWPSGMLWPGVLLWSLWLDLMLCMMALGMKTAIYFVFRHVPIPVPAATTQDASDSVEVSPVAV